ncbi:MAG: sugar phosphate isomerase/epimerase family protein [Armatimonadota bacterium]
MGPWIMFTKHLEGWDLGQIIDGLKRGGVQGADLCVRPNNPVTPENAATELPAAAKRFADEGLSIPLITTPGDFVDPSMDYAESLFEACAEAGVKFVKLGYWYMGEDGYWPTLDRCRKQLEGFSKLAEKTGVKPVVHNHSGATMGINSSAVMRLMDGFDPKLVGVFADVGHLSVVGEPYPMAFSIVKDYLCAVAFKDLVRKRNADGSWAIDVWPLGMGLGNFPQVMQLLKDMSFEGPISFHCEYGKMPPESIIHQLAIDTKFIGDIVEKLG